MLLNKLLDKVKGEAPKYALAALQNPSDTSAFQFGKNVGYIEALSHFEQWINEALEEEDDDEDE